MATWKFRDGPVPHGTFGYSFGPGVANALAIAVPGGFAVVSPPCRVEASAYDEVAKRGPVRLLVASNAYHHMGLPAWKERFPEAEVFAPAQSVARVTKQSKLAGIRPLAEARSLLGDAVDLIDMPHYKSGEVLVRFREGGKARWYATDILMNMPELPPNPIARAVFKWSNSAPGFKFSRLAAFLMVAQKPELKAWLLRTAEEQPPSTILMSHGVPVELTDPLAELRAVIPT